MTVSIPNMVVTMRRLAMGMLAFYAVALLAIMFSAGSPDEALWWVAVLPFLAWTVAPLAVTAFVIRLQTSFGVVTMSTGLMAVAVVSGIYVYVSSMFGEGARSTSALILLFLPIYQWAFPLIAVIFGGARKLLSAYLDD